MNPAEYCREIETYLCRRNGGHLIRIVGPAFEQVCGWATRGVPLKIVLRGIDQYCERYYAKGPRRRPVRVEFCEADVLDLFDGWRRAVGVTTAEPNAAGTEEPAVRKPALASHIERAVARLTTLRSGGKRSEAFAAEIERVVRELDHLAAAARAARGDSRAHIIGRLVELDAGLLSAAVGEVDSRQAEDLKRDVEAELAPFASRMPEESLDRARNAAFHRLVRETLNVPIVSYE